MAGAKRSEKEMLYGRYQGPLHGIPFSIKDNIATQGIRTIAGSKVLGDWIPDFDATAVAKLKEAGAIILGKINMNEENRNFKGDFRLTCLIFAYTYDTSSVMKRVNALQLRQSLGKVVTALQRTGEPILLEKGRKPVAVIISLRDFQERFVEKAATEARELVLAEMDALATESIDVAPAVEVLRELRGNV